MKKNVFCIPNRRPIQGIVTKENIEVCKISFFAKYEEIKIEKIQGLNGIS